MRTPHNYLLIIIIVFTAIGGCGDSFLSDSIYGGELIEDVATINAAIIIEKDDSYLEARLYEEIVEEDEEGSPIVELFVDIGFDGHLKALDSDIETIRSEGVPVSESLDENDETILRAGFDAEGRSVNVRGRLQRQRSVLQLNIVIDNLQMGTLYLERRNSSRLAAPINDDESDDDDSSVTQ